MLQYRFDKNMSTWYNSFYVHIWWAEYSYARQFVFSVRRCSMLDVGDKVVYPMHGAGIIEAVEQHEVMGERRNYFILTMPYGGMRVMIPLDNVENVGLRGSNLRGGSRRGFLHAADEPDAGLRELEPSFQY